MQNIFKFKKILFRLNKEEKKSPKIKKERQKLSAFVDSRPYTFTPNFIRHNGKVMTILQLYVKGGTNRQLNFGDMADIIPTASVSSIESYIIQDDAVIHGEEKETIIRKNSKNLKAVTINQQQEEGQQENKTEAEKETDKKTLGDFDEYELSLNTSEPVVAYNFQVIFIGNDEKSIIDQIENINTIYKQIKDGMRLDSLPSEQFPKYLNIFERYEKNYQEYSSTSRNYTGLNMDLNNGLSDPNGTPIGQQALAYIPSTEFFDFVEHTKTKAFIAIPKSSKMQRYPNCSAASVMAQAVANQVAMNGNRVHHIILNDFDYSDNSPKSNFFRPIETNEIFDFIDMSEQTVNLLEGFGEQKDAVKVFQRLKNKVYDVFDILSHFELSKDKNSRPIILDTLNAFYESSQLWVEEASKNPGLAGILNVKDQSKYPTAPMFLNEFTNLETEVLKQGREGRADSVGNLKSQLENALTTYGKQVNRATNIKKSNTQQVFYNFGKMKDDKILQAVQLINTLEFILHQTEPDDFVVIHGMDGLLDRVTEMLSETINFYFEKGRRFIFAFDQISGIETTNGMTASVFSQKGRLFRELHSETDWTMFGQLLPEEIEPFVKSMNVSFSNLTLSTMQAGSRNARVLVHRANDDVNDFVNLDVLI